MIINGGKSIFNRKHIFFASLVVLFITLSLGVLSAEDVALDDGDGDVSLGLDTASTASEHTLQADTQDANIAKDESKEVKSATKVDPEVTLQDAKAQTNTSVVLRATLPSDATGKVVFKNNGLTISPAFRFNTTNISYYYKIPAYSVRDYNITMVYGGDSKYNSARVNATLTLTRLFTKTNITLNVTHAAPGDTVKLTTKLVNQQNQGITNRFAVKVNGLTLGKNGTNGTGDGFFFFKIPANYKKKTYTYEVVYGETNTCFGVKNSTTLQVANATRTTINQLADTKTTRSSTFRATVVDYKNARLTTGSVVFKFNNKILARVQVKNGSANYTYTIPWMAGGTYPVEAFYSGDSDHADSSAVTNINVVKLNTKVKASNFNATVGSRATTKVTVMDEFNKPVTTGTVQLKVNGSVVSNATVNNGNATLSFTPPITFSNTTNKFQVVYLANTVYFASNTTATVTVNPLKLLYVSPNGSNNNTGNSRDKALKSVALATASIADGGVVYLCPGQYNEANIQLNRSMYVIGLESADKTVIHASKNGYIFNVTRASAVVDIRNITFRNARITTSNSAAIVTSGMLTLSTCNFTDNVATAKASSSVLLTRTGSKNVTIASCNFRNNRGVDDGGVIRALNNPVILYQSKFVGNNLSGSNVGGAVVLFNNSVSSVIQCEFSSNTVNGVNATGGAIKSVGGNITITFTKFNKNNATGSGYVLGGAIISLNSNLYMLNSTFTSNLAKSSSNAGGGAVYSQNGIQLIYNTNYTSNRAEGKDTYGGALYNYNTYASITISSFGSNSAVATGNYSMGGAINFNGGTVIGTSVRITDNVAKAKTAYGGGIYFTGTSFNMNRSLFSKNVADATSSGAGGAAFVQSNAIVTLSNFTNNKASGSNNGGGAIANTGNLTATTNNFVSNVASAAGSAVSNGGTVRSVENNYWGSSSPDWSKLLYKVKTPSKYSKTLI